MQSRREKRRASRSWSGPRLMAVLLLIGLTLLCGCFGLALVATPATTTVPAGSPPPPASPGRAVALTLPPELEERLADAPVPYAGPVEHIFFHPLIAYPERAFDGDWQSAGFDDWFVTVPEFSRILERLYERDYILVHIESLYAEQEQGGRTALVPRTLWLPRGKKPLVISIDDMNYYAYMQENGTVNRLVLDDQGNVAAESTDESGQTVIRYDNAIVPVLDQFVAVHPDFSLYGAKGVIALTGYEGILGYRTNRLGAPEYEAEKEAALRVVRRLKETGWTFASHSWGHRDQARVSLGDLRWDVDHWKAEVEPLVGPTPVHIYPFGSRVTPGTEKFQVLLDAGFRLFAGVGPRPFLQVRSDYAVMDRRHIDGMAFRQRTLLLDLFDARTVIDLEVRPRR